MSEPDPTDSWAVTSSPQRRRRKRATVLLVLIFLVIPVVLLGGVAYSVRYYNWCHGASGPQAPVHVDIDQGATGAEVVAELKAEGVLRCDFVSRYEMRKQDVSVAAGSYDLTTNMTIDSAFKVLAAGPTPVPTVTMTVPEGWRLTQIAAEAARTLRVPEKEFLSLAEGGSYALPPYLPAGKGTAEGFLFPKTYEFVKGEVDADEVITTMLEQFGTEAEGLPWRNAKKLGVSPYEVVVIASMIEREAANDAERPKVASVIYNRLASGTPLYIDATLQYIDPTPDDGLSESELKMDSPYNTRLVKGLPPTPIASPGRASLKAALEPAHTDYVYYVLCGSTHRFTSSYSQFRSWKDSCL